MSEIFREAVENLVGITLVTEDGIGQTSGRIKSVNLYDDSSVEIVVVAWPETKPTALIDDITNLCVEGVEFMSRCELSAAILKRIKENNDDS